MNVLVVEPGYAPYEKEINGLQEMQEVVGGLIQAIYPFQEPVAVVCNDEGQTYKERFSRAELLIGVNGNEPITLKVTPRIKNRPFKQREPPEPFTR